MSEPLILVMDLEATCADDGSISGEQMEIIEIGACWARRSGEVIDQFQMLVRPLERPVLTPFCRQLIGITQAEVDTADLFPVAAEQLARFVLAYKTAGAAWLSWGNYDRQQLARECTRHQLVDPVALTHINGKKLFAKQRRIGKQVGMAKALELVGLTLTGTHHRGLDDAMNIARLLPFFISYIPSY